jgi:hypothetical protein
MGPLAEGMNAAGCHCGIRQNSPAVCVPWRAMREWALPLLLVAWPRRSRLWPRRSTGSRCKCCPSTSISRRFARGLSGAEYGLRKWTGRNWRIGVRVTSSGRFSTRTLTARFNGRRLRALPRHAQVGAGRYPGTFGRVALPKTRHATGLGIATAIAGRVGRSHRDPGREGGLGQRGG